jgi:hypothetical protein
MIQRTRSLRTEFQKGTRQMKARIAEKTKEIWRGKRMDGQFPCSLHEKLVGNEQPYQWLKFGNTKGETESTIVAAQDQAVSTNYFKNKILKEEVYSKCQLCKQHEETIDHQTSGGPTLAKNEYLMRHDKVGVHLHYSMCKALGIERQINGTHTPKPVCEHEDVTVVESRGIYRQRSYSK